MAASSHAELLAAIKASNDSIMVKIDHLVTDVSLIRHDMDKFRSRISEAEGRISQLENTTSSNSRDLRALQKQVKALQRPGPYSGGYSSEARALIRQCQDPSLSCLLTQDSTKLAFLHRGMKTAL